MPGFPGYPQRITDLDARARRAAQRPLPPTRDADGVTLVVGDRVSLLHGCLETRAGVDGDVAEILGDIAVVAFAAIATPVPCYALALRRIEAAGQARQPS